MVVGGVSREGIQGGITAQTTDPVSKNIRAQIANAQKQLQALAADKDMELEEKMERRKEIQQQITDLNQQLRQHEIELRREKQQQVKRSEESAQTAEKKAEKAKEGKEAAGLSQSSMQSMISADHTVKQAEQQGNVASAIKAREGVLKSEIEHSARNAALEKKKESVADIEERLKDIAKSQAENLKKADRELAKAGAKEREEKRVQEADEKSQASGSLREDPEEDGKINRKEAGLSEGAERTGKEAEKENDGEVQAALQAEMPVYRRVDILL